MAISFTINVKSPCEEKWASMDPSAKGRFCQLCEKEVIDFSNLTDKELIGFFQKNHHQKVCGRFRKTQLKTYSTEKRKQKGFLKLALAGFTLLSIIKPTEAFSQGQPYVETGEREYGPAPVAPNEQQKSRRDNFILISGVVKDSATTETLPGVNIQLKGSNIGTVSDLDGKFELKIKNSKDTETIIVSFIGYLTEEIPVKSDEKEVCDLNEILLKPDHVALGETVVVGGAHFSRPSIFKRLSWRIKSIF